MERPRLRRRPWTVDRAILIVRCDVSSPVGAPLAGTLTRQSWTDADTGEDVGTGELIADVGRTYRLVVEGDFAGANPASQGRGCIRSMDAWATVSGLAEASGMFSGMANLTAVPTDAPALTGAVALFAGATAFNGDISAWDVSRVADFSQAFAGARAFNGDINGWDVSNVTSMVQTFVAASSFNRDLDGWDTGRVTDATEMFAAATGFNGDISTWNVSHVTKMPSVFNHARAFNGDLSNWQVGEVKDASFMFASASAFNSDISDWDVRNVTKMQSSFNGASAFGQNLSGWDVAKVTDVYGPQSLAYGSALALNQIPAKFR